MTSENHLSILSVQPREPAGHSAAAMQLWRMLLCDPLAAPSNATHASGAK